MGVACPCPDSLPLFPRFHVCVCMCASTHTFVNPFTLELVFGRCTPPSQAALSYFSNTQQPG